MEYRLTLSNLLVKVFLLILLLFLFVSCTERWKEHQLRQTPTLRPHYKTYVRKELLNQAKYMRNVANKSYQLSYQFSMGTCYPKTIASLNDVNMYLTIVNACDLLRSIQTEMKFLCENSRSFNVLNLKSRYNCVKSPEIISQLTGVITYLEEAEPLFSGVELIKE